MIRLKNQEQLERIRASCKLLSGALAKIKPMISPGVRTIEIDAVVREFIEKGGGRPAFLHYQGYPNSICISINDEVIHGIPGNRKLKEGDIVGLDCGVDLNGFFSDAAITMPVGTIPKEAMDLVETTRTCLEAGLKAIKIGGRIHDISRAVARIAKENGYGIVREFCGHGVGFALHEDPQIPNYVSPGPNPRIQPGMVFAIEPMINLGTGSVSILDDGWTVVTDDGRLSAHFEHTVAVLEDRYEILTEW
jgi:methionyl aminopeptidase